MSDTGDRFFVDAHLHLQDERLYGIRDRVVEEMLQAGVARWVINGTKEDDWGRVAELAREHTEAVACFGLHPWQVKSRTPGWLERLREFLVTDPDAGVGEIGLDKWIRDHDLDDQEKVFRAQLELAVELDRPAMIHCLKCFGRLRDVLADTGLPDDYRFLLHSYGGPKALVEEFAELGAMFSFSGYFLEQRKTDTRDAFAAVPIDRLLIESDAPDMLLPTDLESIPLKSEADGDGDGKRLNHPANLPVIYREVAKLRNLDESELIRQVATNFDRLFVGQPG